MKVYIAVYKNGKRTYDEIDTTRAAYHRWATGGTTIICDGISSSGDAIYATPEDALAHGWSRDLDHYAFTLSPRDLDWKSYDNAITDEHRVNRNYLFK